MDRTPAYFAAPPLPPRHIPRRRLTRALDGAAALPVTLLSAGPGAGKTVLLSEWLRSSAVNPSAWLTLTRAENEPRRFWTRFLSALRACGLDTVELRVAGRSSAFTEIIDWFAAAEAPARMTLILDDAHVLDRPSILDGLHQLIETTNSPLRLILAARSDPLLPLHRYRLAGRLFEIRSDRLAMTDVEARQLLSAHGVTLPQRDLDLLTTRTERWMAGIRLSALRMEGSDRPADFVTELALDEGSVGEYLVSEVLAHQSAEVRQLLIATSFLDEVDGETAGAITGRADAQTVLAELTRTNSFVVAVDGGLTRFRYHQLLREVLRHLGRRHPGDERQAWYQRAAACAEARGDLTHAMRWATEAGDVEYAGRLLVNGGLGQLFLDRPSSSASGLADLVERDVDQHIDDGLVAHWAALAVSADRRSARQQLPAVDPPDGVAAEPSALRATALLARLMLARRAAALHEVEVASAALLSFADQTVGWSMPKGLRAGVLLELATARLVNDGPADVDDVLREAQADAEPVPAVRAEILGLRVLVAAQSARPKSAQEAMTALVELLRRHPEIPTPATLDVARADLAYMLADLPAMAEAADRAMASLRAESNIGVAVIATFMQADLLLFCGRVSEARGTLHDDELVRDATGDLLAVRRDAYLASIETALGRPHAAVRLLAGYRTTSLWELAAIPAARALLSLGQLSDAENAVRAVTTSNSPRVNRRTLVDALLTEALIAQARQDEPRALDLILRAVQIAGDDLVLPFARVADVVGALLRRHPTVAAAWPTPLTTASGPLAPPRTPAKPPDPLTARELAVLRFLSTSMSTGEIADELCLSINTVKTHLAAIYRKLSARKRREAVIRARELELL